MQNTRTISYLACRLCPGTQAVKVHFTSTSRDMTLVTAGRILYVDSSGVDNFWTMAIVGTPTTHEAVLQHFVTTGDLTEAMIGTSIALRGLFTWSGVEMLDEPIPFLLSIVA